MKRCLLPCRPCLVVFVLLSLALICPATEALSASRNVLVIASYDHTDSWTRNVIDGIASVLEKDQDLVLHVEYLDTRRHGDPSHLPLMASYIEKKYRNTSLDLVLVSDDAALDFFLGLEQPRYRAAPLVFCGINNFVPSRLNGRVNATGVNEAVDIVGTVALARSLVPQVRTLAVVLNDRGMGRINAELFQRAAPDLAGDLDIRMLSNLSREGAAKILRELPPDAVVLRLANLVENNTTDISLQESMRILAMQSPVPVFSFWEFDMGAGAMGGVVASGFLQGSTAAGLAKRILAGEAPASLPIVMQSPNISMLDYPQLQRFGIDADSLPQDIRILDKPASFYRQHQVLILFVIGAFLGLLAILTALAVNIARRKAAERQVRENMRMLEVILDALPQSIFWKNTESIYLGCNQAFAIAAGVKRPAEIVGKSDFDLPWTREESMAYRADDRSVMDESKAKYHISETLRHADGNRIHLDTTKLPLVDEQGKVYGIVGVFEDVTQRLRTEEKISASLREKEALLKEIHHRVKNNLQIIISLLNLQAMRMSDPRLVEALGRSQSRVRSMALVHEKLYRSPDMSSIDFSEYIRDLANHIARVHDDVAHRVALRLDLKDVSISLDQALPAGLVVNEIVTNAYKHAFPDGRSGCIDIGVHADAEDVVIVIRDSGPGLSDLSSLGDGKSLGHELIKGLVRQLKGNITIENRDGARFTIRFPRVLREAF